MRALFLSTTFVIALYGAAWMVLPSSGVTSTRVPIPRPARIATPLDWPSPSERIDPADAAGTVDLYGNEVSDAVAKYRTDTTGTIYELHSPHTELPRLGSAKT